MKPMNPVIAIHGGAGTITRSALGVAQEKNYRDALDEVLAGGQRILEEGGSALDAVTEAVVRLEECPLFNAGKGAVFTQAGTHELDAAIMDGRALAAGAVACVSSIRSPVRAARAVMEDGRHVLLVGAGADAFAAQAGLECVAPGYYYTEARHAQWKCAQDCPAENLLDHDAQSLFAQAAPLDPETKMGTVGAVALDGDGNLAAATSTGGVTQRESGTSRSARSRSPSRATSAVNASPERWPASTSPGSGAVPSAGNREKRACNMRRQSARRRALGSGPQMRA